MANFKQVVIYFLSVKTPTYDPTGGIKLPLIHNTINKYFGDEISKMS